VKRRDSVKALSALTAHVLFPSVLARAAEAAAGVDAGAAWAPQWIRPERAAMLEALVDTILPATATPGAKQARVQVFVDLALRDCYTPAEQQLFADGLEALAGASQSRHGRPFEDCSP
jgi:glucoside 3-dehydrogenase (cytochrome c) hitch-hiker subunit